MRFENVPLSPPRWLTSDVAAAAAGAIGVATTSPLSVIWLKMTPGFERLEHRHVILPALIASALLVASALAARTPGAAVARLILGSPLAGALAGLGTWLVVESGLIAPIFGDLIPTGPAPELPVPLSSALIGIAFGATYGVVLLWPVAVAASALRKCAHDAPDHALLGLGLWLVSLGACSLYALSKTCCDSIGYEALAAGSALAASATLRLRARRHWLSRVRQGNVPSWSIESWEPLHGSELAPLLERALECDGVLIHQAPAEKDPYRKSGQGTIVGLVPTRG